VRAAVLVEPRKFEIQEFERPVVTTDAALLRVEICGLCGTDVDEFHGRMHRNGLADLPCIPGHEPVGVIEEIGPVAAQRWKLAVGDRVAVEAHLACGACSACLEGEARLCERGDHREVNYGFIGTEVAPSLWGGYSEYLHLDPRSVLHPVSPSLPNELAAMFNPVGAGVRWAVERPNLRLGDTVAIFGCGQRGLACLIAAKAAGARQVIAIDLSRAAAKLELALALGADHVVVADEEPAVERVLELTGGRGVDVVVELTPGATRPVTQAVAMVRRGGTVILAGLKDMAPIPEFVSDQLVLRSIRLEGVFAVDSRSFRRAIEMLEADPAPFARFGTRTYPLERAAEAIARLSGEDGEAPAIHVAIEPGRGASRA
jgi:threonine dehydrogenase-like Zn-dependent dehydrogenase